MEFNWIYIGLVAQTLGSILLLGGYAPQIIKLHRTKNPTGISLLFWLMIAIGCTSISINMYATNAPIEVQITQGLNATFAWYTLALVLYCKKLRSESIQYNYIIGSIFALISGFMFTFVQNNTLEQIGYAFQLIGIVALLTAYLPQIVHLYTVKDATGISRWLYIILGSGLLLVTANMIITKTAIEIIITEFINIGLIFVQYWMTVYYQNKKN